jgi:hypothetical protein
MKLILIYRCLGVAEPEKTLNLAALETKHQARCCGRGGNV